MGSSSSASISSSSAAMPLAVSSDGVDCLCLSCYAPLRTPPNGFRLDKLSPTASKPSQAFEMHFNQGLTAGAEAYPLTDLELFCGGSCRASYVGRRCSSSLRRQLEGLDGAVCAACGLDAPSVCQALSEAPPGAPRASLLRSLAPRIAAEPGLAQRLLDAPHLAGNVWHADHVLAVRDGGGECTVENMQVLCVACHLDKTRREGRERRARSAGGGGGAFGFGSGGKLKQGSSPNKKR